MVTAKSVIEMSGPPPFLPYNPVGRGEGREHIEVRQREAAIGISVTEGSALTPQVSSAQSRHAPLSLEVIDRDGIHTFLRDIPFEILVSDDRVFTLSSKNQQTHWRFLIMISASSKQMKMQFTLSYAGQTIDEAVAAINFYAALAEGGVLRIHGRHPLTGGEVYIATGKIPAGSFRKLDKRFERLLRHLQVIQEKTGTTFVIPDRDIGFDEANFIASTAEVLKTGHARYTAQPWVSVCSVERARAGLETFASGKPVPMALHYDAQEVEIFGTRIALGPVTFFCERTYVTKKDLSEAQQQLDQAQPGDLINIRFTPFDACPIEARYINWVPADEAERLRRMPMYLAAESEQAESQIKQLAHAQGTKPLRFEELLGPITQDDDTYDIDKFLSELSKWRNEPASRRSE
ncbi:MAG TPA: hypothetical protein VIX17_03960 [Pyrinomonadaceae bacterium]